MESGADFMPPAADIPELPDTVPAVDPYPAAEVKTEEPDELTIFMAKWESQLVEKRQHEDSVLQEALSAAAQQKEQLDAERTTRRARKMESNRAEEQAFMEAQEESSDSDNVWERVLSLVEVQQDVKEATNDTSRMRKILIELKNEQHLGAKEALDA